jgi:hypothetical protein
LKKIKDIKWVEGIVQGFFIISTILFLLSPDYFFFKKSLEFANYILVIFILCGLIFLIIDSGRLVITTFLCAGALAMFLKSNSASARPEKNVPSADAIAIAVIDLSKVTVDKVLFAEYLDSLRYGIYLFNNVDSSWSANLDRRIPYYYESYKTTGILDLPIISLYSRLPFKRVETLFSYNVPAIQAIMEVPKNGRHIMFVGLDLPSPESGEDYTILDEVLTMLSSQLDKDLPVVCAGDYNLVPWSKEIQNFKLQSKMQGTVHKINPLPIFKTMDKSYRPTNHILHANEMICLEFGDLVFDEKLIGVQGKYQLK